MVLSRWKMKMGEDNFAVHSEDSVVRRKGSRIAPSELPHSPSLTFLLIPASRRGQCQLSELLADSSMPRCAKIVDALRIFDERAAERLDRRSGKHRRYAGYCG